MAVEYMSFSAHADAKGIMQLIQYCEPKNVMLVHGEAVKMDFLKEKIKEEFKIDCYTPANGETCVIHTPVKIPVDASLSLLKAEAKKYNAQPPDPKRRRLIHGILVMKDNKISLMDVNEVSKEAGINRHILRYFIYLNEFKKFLFIFCKLIFSFTSKIKIEDSAPNNRIIERLYKLLQEKLTEWTVVLLEDSKISVETVIIKAEGENTDQQKNIVVSWTNQDEDIGSYILGLIQNLG